jgi:hypothetical protein
MLKFGKQSPLKQEWNKFLKSSSLFVRNHCFSFKDSVKLKLLNTLPKNIIYIVKLFILKLKVVLIYNC